MKTETSLQVAETICAQLGGRRFAVMTGAKNFVGYAKSLQFSLPNNFAKDGINKVCVTLEPCNTYKVEFFKIRGTTLKLIAECDGVYCDMLQDIFESKTGLICR